MAKKILVANWKNNPDTIAQAKSLISSVAKHHAKYKKLHTYILPPLPYFGLVSEKVGKYAKLGVQEMPVDEGTSITGNVTPSMVKSFGAKIAIIGHSERRIIPGEDMLVPERVITALKNGIAPLLCIGENEHDAEGEYLHFLRNQLRDSLAGVRRKADVEKLMIAYEPVWAIGKPSKSAMNPKDLTQTVIYIRKILSDMYERESADKVAILYGGSVDPNNAEELIKETPIDGLLVGRSSLNAKTFLGIAEKLI